MTRKDFELIAETIRKLGVQSMRNQGENFFNKDDVEFVACRFAQALKQTNPRFKPDTFVEACLKEK